MNEQKIEELVGKIASSAAYIDQMIDDGEAINKMDGAQWKAAKREYYKRYPAILGEEPDDAYFANEREGGDKGSFVGILLHEYPEQEEALLNDYKEKLERVFRKTVKIAYNEETKSQEVTVVDLTKDNENAWLYSTRIYPMASPAKPAGKGESEVPRNARVYPEAKENKTPLNESEFKDDIPF